jgi:dTMP kinase
VCDRFLLANIVYQGAAGGLGVEAVGAVGRVATGGLLPDLTVVLDVPTAVARARVGPARDRMEDRPAEYQERVRAGFLDAARAAAAGGCSYYPAPVAVVDGASDADAVAAAIRSEVQRVLAIDPRP